MLIAIKKYLGWGALVLFIACLATMRILVLQNQELSQKNKTTAIEREQFKQHAAELYAANTHYVNVIARNKKRFATLLNKIETSQRQQISYQSTIKKLERNNEMVKNWSDTPLPSDINRLFNHQAFTRTEDYEQWLSERFTLYPAREQPPDQP